MKTILSKILLPVMALGVLVAFQPLPAYADGISDTAKIIRGGKLYDKWFKVIKAEKPKETHKAWPTSNTKKKGNTTWRCKSCHGWDTKGKDGAYAGGSYKTGIPGIRSYMNKDSASIIAVLKDSTHGLAGKMSDADFSDLAMFVSKGQIVMENYIDGSTKKIKGGNVAPGKIYYQTLCMQCHGASGELPKDMPMMGKLMGNPWETMHKIMNGQPAEKMPSLRALNTQVTLDIMSYMGTLPKK